MSRDGSPSASKHEARGAIIGAEIGLWAESLLRRLANFESLARNSAPSNFELASGMEDGSSNSTNADPRSRPVVRSTGRNASLTSLTWAKSVSTLVWVALMARLPTKTFEAMTPS